MIGVVDTNSDPQGVDFVIPGNDDAIRAVRIFVAAFADAILEGRLAAGESIDDIAAAEREMLASYEAKQNSTVEAEESDEESTEEQASEDEGNEHTAVVEGQDDSSEVSNEATGDDESETEAQAVDAAADSAESEAEASTATARDAAQAEDSGKS